MKKLLLLSLVAGMFISCSPQKRAAWHMNRAMKLNPLIIQTFDSVIKISDTTYLMGDTVSLPCSDTVFRQGKLEIIIKDKIVTVRTPNDTIIKTITKQIKGKAYPVYKDEPFYKEDSFALSLLLGLLLIGVVLILLTFLKVEKTNYDKH